MPDDTVPAPAFQDDADILPAPRRNIQAEFALQRAVKWFVARAVACDHEFAGHDRSGKQSPGQHIGEAARGIRRGWPDTELVIDGGRTFRCELKAPGKKLEDGGDQDTLLRRLQALGHPAAWANSVAMYAEAAYAAGVPLRQHWRDLAAVGDARVAEDIRKQQARAGRQGVGGAPRGKRAAKGGGGSPRGLAVLRRAGWMV